MHHIRLLNKRDKTSVYPDDLIIIDIDRPSGSILQNPFPMKNHNDDVERDNVVRDYAEYFEHEFEHNPKLSAYMYYLAGLVADGKKLALRCWCHPKKCHGHVVIEKLNLLNSKQKDAMTTVIEPPKKEVPAFLVQKYSEDEIDYKECRFVIHMPKGDGRYDWHMVKEVLHFKDGRPPVPNIRYVRDYKVKYWVARVNLRESYTQKKEWENLDRLTEGESTASDLWKNIAFSLGRPGLVTRPDILRDSPHVYGTDIPSTVSIKYDYFKKMGDRKSTPFKISYSDTETNMLNLDQGASKHILMQSLFFEGKMYMAVVEDFLKTVPNPRKALLEMYDEYMPQQGKDMVKELVIDIVKSPIDVVKAVFKKAHEWQPDFMAFWNLIFDLDKIIECIEEAGYRPEEILNDPNLPPQLRTWFLKRANPNKTSASGRTMTKKPADQWHSALNPASFYFIDQMATYRFIRKSKQLEPSYGLDEILKKELKGLGKLKHKPAEGLNKAEFHIFMQERYPGEYCIYHMWDVLSMPVLDEETRDLAYSLPSVTGFSDFMSFESEPKRYIHNFHHFILEKHNSVTGCAGKSLVQEFDSMTISGQGHIVTLEPHLTVDTGLKIFKDYSGLRTNFYSHCADLDVKSSYPYGQWLFNMSRTTTVRELISIEGVRDQDRRIQGLNLSGGRTNAVEFTNVIFGTPTHSEINRFFDQANKN